MPSGKSLKKAVKPPKRKPVWEGPESNGPQGGVTQSLLSSFLIDRERFRLYAIEGLKSADTFDHKLEFGNMWHACEESHSRGESWYERLDAECETLSAKYPLSRADIHKWKMAVRTQFPVYLDYWKSVPRRSGKKKSIMQEQIFCVPYKLPSGRTVYLRGKWDEVYELLEKKLKSIIINEHKTKGEVDEVKVRRQLLFDIQTLLYTVALDAFLGEGSPPIRGIDYNVIRRPFSGGRGSITRHKPTKKNPRGESEEDFYARLANDYIRKEPKYWFMNIEVDFYPDSLPKFKKHLLNPILENLCDWYTWVTSEDDIWDEERQIIIRRGMFPVRTVDYSIHWRMPYLFNPIVEGWTTDFDYYLESGTETGLRRVDNLFEELTNAENH